MQWLSRWWRRARGLVRNDRRERAMDEELRHHIQMERDELIAQGVGPADAERRARLAFGGLEQVKEEARDARGGRWIEDFGRDVSTAIKSLAKTPGYTAVVVLSLALGIGSGTAIFGVVNGVLLRPLPLPDPGKLVLIWDGLDWLGVPEAWVTGPEIVRLRSEATRLSAVAAYRTGSAAVGDQSGSDPAQLRFSLVSADFFDVLGVTPAIGRVFRPGEDVAGVESMVVLTHGLWQRRWGGDLGVVGRRVDLDGELATVIGVLPPGASFAAQSSLGVALSPEFYANLRVNLAEEHQDAHGFGVLARVGPRSTLAEAKAELGVLGSRLDRERYQEKGFRFVVVGVQERLVRSVRPALLVILSAIGLLLAIMSANLATLALGRAARRDREFAVRGALGAGRFRLARQVLTEAVVCSLAGGGLALLVATFGVRGLVALGPADLPRREEIAIDVVVLGFGVGLALVVGIATGLLPALRMTGRDAAAVLRRTSTTITGRRMRGALVVGQVALSTMLLVAASLLLASLTRLLRTDPGFATAGVLMVDIDARASRNPEPVQVSQFFGSVLERARGLPGVRAAGFVSSAPLAAATQQRSGRFPGSDVEGDMDDNAFLYDAVSTSPGYFVAMGVDLIEGRGFVAADAARPNVVVIDETLARRFFPGQSALGQGFMFFGDTTRLEVIGVVRHPRLYSLETDGRGQVYFHHTAWRRRAMTLTLGTDGDPTALIPAVRAVVSDLDPGQPLARVATIRTRLEASVAQRRLVLVLMAAFAAAAVGLASLGIYGVAGTAVTQRIREIGIRAALGARAGQLVWTVLRRPLWMVGVGLLLGLGGSLAAAAAVRRLLFGVAPTDPVILGGVVVALGVIGAVAGLVPARRATAADPTLALRSE